MGAGIRRVDDNFWVAPQIGVEDITPLRALGVRVIVNNRPDDEEPGQIAGAELETAATAAGLAYIDAPVSGGPTQGAIEAMTEALAQGPVLAFCRSGTRSMLVWALSQIGSDRRDRDDVLALARNAGFELSRWI
jgi:uncharacterized protein (TIGR01244 family)